MNTNQYLSTVIFPELHPTLHIDNLVLRKVTAEDLIELGEIVAYRPNNDLTAAQMLEKVALAYEDKSSINWGIYLNNELIGTIGFYRGFENDIAEVGYVTREKYRSKGFTSKGVQRILDYGMNEMKLKGIVAYTSESNSISQALLEKLNFELVESEKPEYIKYRLK